MVYVNNNIVETSRNKFIQYVFNQWFACNFNKCFGSCISQRF